jgi:peptidoglycan/xylan/chitin deacetylase (PgdA/CDA1 family)
VLVLCYHAISERWPAHIAVRPADLERHLSRFLAAGYRGATFTDAITRPASPRTLVVTFDDAYGSVLARAYPILARHGVPGTVFVPTDHQAGRALRSGPRIDRWLNGPWEKELAGLSWEELAQLAAAGWEIGSHARSHVQLPGLHEGSLAAELDDSRRECEERLGMPCRSIAYPYGDHDERVAAAARAAGYVVGATISGPRDASGGPPDPMRWPRLPVLRADRSLGLRAKAALYRHPRAWNLALGARRVLRSSSRASARRGHAAGDPTARRARRAT